MYLYNGISNPTPITGGFGYANGESLVFSGGGTTSQAKGYITTDSNGTIVFTTLLYQGSGYDTLPSISVQSNNGYGAAFTTTITEYNTTSQVKGKVVKSGTGRKKGYWSTTRGFLNSDKYIQDDYYYQDFSYEIQTPIVLNTYKDILYNTFHVSGTELFGKFVKRDEKQSLSAILYEATSHSNTVIIYEYCDSTLIKCDNENIRIDSIPYIPTLTCDINTYKTDSNKITADMKLHP
mgnify:CR=1 FL=1